LLTKWSKNGEYLGEARIVAKFDIFILLLHLLDVEVLEFDLHALGFRLKFKPTNRNPHVDLNFGKTGKDENIKVQPKKFSHIDIICKSLCGCFLSKIICWNFLFSYLK
jgi:hypothetical protein